MDKVSVDQIWKQTAASTGIDREDLNAFFAKAEKVGYKPEEWLFHESMPRRWAGVVMEGEVEIIRGLHGSSKHLAVLGPGALIAESAILSDLPHSTGAMTRKGATIWRISREGHWKISERPSRISSTASSHGSHRASATACGSSPSK